jgi:hypothetical protein
MTSPQSGRQPGRSPVSLVTDEQRYSDEPELAPADGDSGPADQPAAAAPAAKTPRRRRPAAATSATEPKPTRQRKQAAGTTKEDPPKRSGRTTTGGRRAPAPTPPPASDDGLLEGEAEPGEARDGITNQIPRSLKARIDGIVTHAALYGDPEEIDSQVSFVRIACHRLAKHYEETYNKGKSFPAPRRLPPGRRPGGR